MGKKITNEHVELVKDLLSRMQGVLPASTYMDYFLVSRPTALKRLRKIGDMEQDLECVDKTRNVNQTCLIISRF